MVISKLPLKYWKKERGSSGWFRSREMLYINQRLLPQDRKEADKRAAELKTALAELDEAARLQDGSRLTKEYSRVASGFGAYAEMIPADALS